LSNGALACAELRTPARALGESIYVAALGESVPKVALSATFHEQQLGESSTSKRPIDHPPANAQLTIHQQTPN
jgi:hypothetical protein